MVMVNNENVNNNDVGYVNDGERGATGNVRIPGPLKPVDDSKTVAFTGDIYDDRMRKNQREINKIFHDGLSGVLDANVPYYRDNFYKFSITPQSDNYFYEVPIPENKSTEDSMFLNSKYMRVRKGDIVCFKVLNTPSLGIDDANYEVEFKYWYNNNGTLTQVASQIVSPNTTYPDDYADIQIADGKNPLFSLVPDGATHVTVTINFRNKTRDLNICIGSVGISELLLAIVQDRFTSGGKLEDIFATNPANNIFKTKLSKEIETISADSALSTPTAVTFNNVEFKQDAMYRICLYAGSSGANTDNQRYLRLLNQDLIVTISGVSIAKKQDVTTYTPDNGTPSTSTHNTTKTIFERKVKSGEVVYLWDIDKWLKVGTFDNPNTTVEFGGFDEDRIVSDWQALNELYSNITITITLDPSTRKLNTDEYGYGMNYAIFSIEEAAVEHKFITLFRELDRLKILLSNANQSTQQIVQPIQDLKLQLHHESIGYGTLNSADLLISSPVVIVDVDPSENCNYVAKITNESSYTPSLQIRIYNEAGALLGTLYDITPEASLNYVDSAHFNLQGYAGATTIAVYCQAMAEDINSDSLKHGSVRIDVYKVGILDDLEEIRSSVSTNESFHVTSSRTISDGTTSGIITLNTAIKTTSVDDIVCVIIEDKYPQNNSGVGNISFTLSLYGGHRGITSGPQDVIKVYNGTNTAYFIAGVTAYGGLKGVLSFQTENAFTGVATIDAHILVLSTHAAIAALFRKVLSLPATTSQIINTGGVASLSSGNLKVLNAATNTLQQDANEANTTYEIRDDITLDGTWTVPANVSLFFNGGSISGGTINFNNTYVYGKPKFINNNYTGELSNTEVYFGWFSPSTALTYDNSTLLTKAISVSKETLFIETMYPLAETVTITKRISLKGVSSKAMLYADLTANAKQGFRMTACKTAFVTGAGANLSMFGLTILGVKNLYTGGNMRVTSGAQGTFTDTDQFGNTYSINVVAPEGGITVAGISMPLTGYINTIQDCAICGFTYGIKTMGGGIDKLTDNYFSACRWGVHFSGYTSDMMITNNKFNTCGNDVNYKNINLSGSSIDISNNAEYLKEVAGGLYLRGTGMVQLDHNRFEFNFIQIVLDEANIACQIQDNMFDKATCTHILVYNGTATAFLSQQPSDRERFQPAFSGILIDGNTFLRGANIQSNAGTASFSSIAGESIFYIMNGLESQTSGFTEAAGYSENRGCILTINNNVVTDFIEVDRAINASNIHYPNCVFKIHNGGDGGLIINANGNDFTNSKAENIVDFVYGSSGKVYFNDNGSNFGSLNHAMWNDILVLNKFEIQGSKLVIYNSQSDGTAISQDYEIDLSNYTLTAGTSSPGGTSAAPADVYTKTEVDTLLNQLSLNSGSNPFATGNAIVVSGSESNLTTLLSSQNKTYFIKGNVDLNNTDFHFAANSKYIFLNSAVNNALEVYLDAGAVVQGAKFNGFKSIVLGADAILRDCDCNGQNASMGIYFNGHRSKILYNRIHGIRNTFGDTTAAVRSHRTGRGSYNYYYNLECSHNLFYDVTPRASGTVKLCVIYLNEVTVDIDNNLILGIHDENRAVGGEHDLDLIHLLADSQFTDGSDATYTLPYGWKSGGGLTSGTDAGFSPTWSRITNNTFRGIGYIKSVFKMQTRNTMIENNLVCFDDTVGEWYSVFRFLRGDHFKVSGNTAYHPNNKQYGNFVQISQCTDLTFDSNVWSYARQGMEDLRDSTHYVQPTWFKYDIVIQTSEYVVFSNNKIYVNNRNSLPSWQCCHGLIFKDNVFHFRDPICQTGYNIIGTYLSSSVITHNPTTMNSEVLWDNNKFYIDAYARSYTSSNIAIFAFPTDKYMIFKNNHIKAPCPVQFDIFRISGAKLKFINNTIDAEAVKFNTNATYGNIGNGNATTEYNDFVEIEGMNVDDLNVRQINNLKFKDCTISSSSNSPIRLNNVTAVYGIGNDYSSSNNANLIKVESGNCTVIFDGLGVNSGVNNTGAGTVTSLFSRSRTSGTTAQRPANVYVGYIYYDTTVGYHVYWTGSEWVQLSSGSGGTSGGGGSETPSGGGEGGSEGGGSSEGGGTTGGGGTSEGGGGSEGGGTSETTPTVEGQSRLAIAESQSPSWSAADDLTEVDAILDEGCYVIDEANGKMAKLKSDDHTKFADGTSWDGTYGNAFRHIPTIYYKVDNGNLIVSRTSFTGCKTLPETWIGLYQGYIDGDGALRSIPDVTTTGNKTAAEFFAAAQENGNNYGIMSYYDQQMMVFLYLMKYHNTNSETLFGDSDISLVTGYNTFTTGYTASLGDGSGYVTYATTQRTIGSLFGVEGIVSSRLEFRQNIVLDQSNNLAYIYEGNTVTIDQNTVMRSIANPVANENYIQELTWGEYGDIVPKTAQTGSTGATYKNQYYCDIAIMKDGAIVVQGGLPAYANGSGLFFMGSDPETVKGANYGARLCLHNSSSNELVTGSALAALNA